jgi:GNAT superfamily N-acetyltransferase
MLTQVCDACETKLSGSNREELLANSLEHFKSAHPKWGATETSASNWLDAKERLTGSTERVPEIGSLEVHRVTGERVDDLLRFFDHDGFADNPGWASCYCVFYHQEELTTPEIRPWQQNRAEIEKRLRDGTTVGFLAYADGKPVGWCNASPRSAYPVRRKGKEDDDVGVVACFVIAPAYRRHGVARALLDSAVENFRKSRMKRVEAHPVLGTDADAANYHGPLPLYIEAGFKEAERDERTVLVMKDLT